MALGHAEALPYAAFFFLAGESPSTKLVIAGVLGAIDVLPTASLVPCSAINVFLTSSHDAQAAAKTLRARVEASALELAGG